MFEQLLLDFIARHYPSAAHSIFAPSSSARWMTCAGSLVPGLLAQDKAGFDAAEGTVAHELHEEWLKTGEQPLHRLGEIVPIDEGHEVFEIEITHEMMDAVEESVSRLIYMPGTKFVEVRVDFSQLTPIPHQGGTADWFSCEPGVLRIRDYKHGKGVFVDVEENSQALLYALGVFFEWDWLYDFQEIDIGIHQPRLDNMAYWTIDRRTLLAFAKKVKKTAKAAWVLNGPLLPSAKACQFCPLNTNCPAFLKVAQDLSDEAFADLIDPIGQDTAWEIADAVDVGLFDPTLREPSLLSTRALANSLPFRGMFEKWFNNVEQDLEQRAIEGQRIPGKKLVEARTNRVFVSERKAIERLAEAGISWTNLYKTSFASPAGAEDMLQKIGMKRADAVKFLEPVVRKPPGKPTLVSENDKRPAYQHPDEGVFDDLTSD